MTYGVDAGVEKWGGDGFKTTYTNPDNYYRSIVNTTTNTGVSSLVNRESGGEFWNNLGEAYKTLAIDTAAKEGANFIGDQYIENRKQDAWESRGQSTNSVSTYLTHKTSHALLGCAVGAAKAGECASGAAGAVIGEIVGEAVGNPLIQDGEFSETDERLVKIAGTTAAIFGTSALGGDFNVASDTAQNAIENNLIFTSAVLIAIAVGAASGAAWSVGEQVAEGVIVEDQSLLEAAEDIDYGEVGIDAAIGGVLGGVGGWIIKGGKYAYKGAKIAKKTKDINPKVYKSLEKQLKKDGPKSILKALESTKKTHLEHIEKLSKMRYKSQVENTIRNTQRNINTINQFIKNNNIK